MRAVFRHFQQGFGQGFGLFFRHEQAVVSVHDALRPAAAGGDDGQALRQGFDEYHAEGFVAAGEYESVAAAHQPQNRAVIQRAEEIHRRIDFQTACLTFQSRLFHAAAADFQPQIRPFFQRAGEGVQ